MNYNRDLVIKKAKKCFPDEDSEIIIALLDNYKTESPGRERVQLAILKLSGGNVDELPNLIQMAKIDCRDVLAYAEYPEEMKRVNLHFNDKREEEQIRKRDLEQYLNWLNE